MRAFGALILDAYRELNSRRLFWVILALSGLFVLFYASIGFDETGMFMFFGLKHFDNELLTTGSPFSKLLYRGIFATFVVPIWLAWIATILALVSTASIFPEFVAGGSIDLVLCKPITRLGLFLNKYLASLMFVVLQVSLFCVGVFLAMGWRIGDWDPKVFLAVPIVTLMFSYLYSFCVLIGVWTRSTLTALLLTMLLWFGNFAITQTEEIVNMVKTNLEIDLEETDEEIARLNAASSDTRPSRQASIMEEETAKDRETLADLNSWLGAVRIVRYPLPKTSETVALLDRTLARDGDVNLMDLMTGNVELGPGGKARKKPARGEEERAQRRMIEEADQVSAWFIIGSSLAFEAVVLGLAAFVFVRRDY